MNTPRALPAAPDAELVIGPDGGQHNATAPDWSRFGALFPVLAGSSGAGASVFAAALADALAAGEQCTLLVDPAEPARSGLACAGSDAVIYYGDGVRWSWRGNALVGQLRDFYPQVTPPPSPQLESWIPPFPPVHATVVDLGSDWATVPAGPSSLENPSSWLRTTPGSDAPRPFPLLVVRPTRPSLIAAEAALARYHHSFRSGEMAGPAQLVVMAAWKPRWPPGVAGAAGARLAPLLEDALFVPYDGSLELGGITEALTSPRIRDLIARFLRGWGPSPLFRPANQRGRH